MDMRFFFDNNLSYRLAKGMQEFGEEVEHLRDSFNRDAQDVDWLPYVGNQGLFLVTKDKRIRKNPSERALLKQHKIGTFFLIAGDKTHWQIVEQIVRNWTRIKNFAEENNKKRPFICRIRASGKNFDTEYL